MEKTTDITTVHTTYILEWSKDFTESTFIKVYKKRYGFKNNIGRQMNVCDN